MSKYTIGVDFGTLSARALVAEIGTGRELGVASMDYPHGVMDSALPDGTPLPPDWALQSPRDFWDCLGVVIAGAVRCAGIAREDVIGLGIDATSCTVLPVDACNVPLCEKPEYSGRPHAWMMMWKHHAAQNKASRITEIVRERGDALLERYGGRVSSEWLLPRMWQVLDEAPEVYAAADHYIDVGDWLVSRLTRDDPSQAPCRSACIAGYKYFRDPETGYPSHDFLTALDPRLAERLPDQLRGQVLPAGSLAGRLTAAGARHVGLHPGTPVAVANIDAHVCMPSIGPVEPGDYLMILGTSTCHMLTAEEDRFAPGICGAVKDGLIPGMMGYEAGQSCVGDHFAWAARTCCPPEYHEAAKREGRDIHGYLTQLAEGLRPGESGLLALDWWNGNRSVLVDADLTGLMLGMTLATKPEEIYRALVEATAYGARTIIENFESHGLPVRRVFACGGIARKNPFIMQLYANVLNREIRVAASSEAAALGSAMFGAVAAGRDDGGYDSILDAAAEMGHLSERRYLPRREDACVYERLFREYTALHDWFGRGGSDVMKRLKIIRAEQK